MISNTFKPAPGVQVICAQYEVADTNRPYLLDISVVPTEEIQYSEITEYGHKETRDCAFYNFDHIKACQFYMKAVKAVNS